MFTAITLSRLQHEEYGFQNLTGLRQHWRNHAQYVYSDFARPDNGIILILCHKAVFTLSDGSEIIAGRGDMLLLPAGSYYKVTFSVTQDEQTIASLLLNFTLCNRAGEKLSVGVAPVLVCRDTDGSCRIRFERAIDAYNAGRSLSQKSELLSLLCRMQEHQTGRQNQDIFEEMTAYIKENPAAVLRVGDLAKHFYISESTVRRLFYSRVGVSPQAFLAAQKTEKIKQMLLLPEVTLAELCELFGFFDASHLYRFFVKQTGMTPGEWKKEQKSEER